MQIFYCNCLMAAVILTILVLKIEMKVEDGIGDTTKQNESARSLITVLSSTKRKIFIKINDTPSIIVVEFGKNNKSIISSTILTTLLHNSRGTTISSSQTSRGKTRSTRNVQTTTTISKKFDLFPKDTDNPINSSVYNSSNILTAILLLTRPARKIFNRTSAKTITDAIKPVSRQNNLVNNVSNTIEIFSSSPSVKLNSLLSATTTTTISYKSTGSYERLKNDSVSTKILNKSVIQTNDNRLTTPFSINFKTIATKDTNNIANYVNGNNKNSINNTQLKETISSWSSRSSKFVPKTRSITNDNYNSIKETKFNSKTTTKLTENSRTKVTESPSESILATKTPTSELIVNKTDPSEDIKYYSDDSIFLFDDENDEDDLIPDAPFESSKSSSTTTVTVRTKPTTKAKTTSTLKPSTKLKKYVDYEDEPPVEIDTNNNEEYPIDEEMLRKYPLLNLLRNLQPDQRAVYLHSLLTYHDQQFPNVHDHYQPSIPYDEEYLRQIQIYLQYTQENSA